MITIRDGKYSLIGWRKDEYPKDQDAIRKVMDSMRVIIEEHLGRELTQGQLWDECYNSPLNTPEWNELRSKFVMLNEFQEAWIPLIKSGSAGISRFELYDLSNDPGQKRNVSEQFPEVADRLKQTVLEINADVLEEAPDWESKAVIKKGLQIHRLQSTKRSIFDAFVYVNRIPVEPETDESQVDLAGRILGRLANQEGRILVKLHPGMNRSAYEGFKIALDLPRRSASREDFRPVSDDSRTAAEDSPKLLTSFATSCFSCHYLPELGNTTFTPPIPSLRNRSYSKDRLRVLLQDDTHKSFQIDTTHADLLHAFLQTLADVPDTEFRDLILKATVLDTSGDSQ